ncbi:6-phosphofructokinase [Spiroplasma sabaudiense Ar-1343]|uniref:ATP-dependent 6-phosphofructokinase n=1 Tax=Spiroplasma sabaudiense Ar-1343 TaxID=1276257 RepID=W6A9A4_9MOLU|nr:6-phosphofructokinase [Spiroplasma sabaudiense]AHI53561.1 6-phosphofructokinase [Spiroplasma sabaudiense Ar-1343]
MIKKIGVLTSGGDAPGMNAAVGAVIKTAIANKITPFIVKDGYKGLVNNWIEEVNETFANDIISRGGTVIGSARLPEFKDIEVRKKAVKNLQNLGIEALVVIGGDGSYQGAQKLTEMGINCIGLPDTIDNDIVSSDYTIGFDTALNTVVEAIDKIRDTAQSHNRCMVIEIMGNACGDLTLFAAVATGAEVISVPESKLSEEEICNQVSKLAKDNRRSVIVAISEKIYPSAEELAKKIQKASGYDSRATVLGHIQRGGSPTAMDRYLSVTAGIFAVEQLIAGKGGLYIGLDKNELVARDIDKTLNMERKDVSKLISKIREINANIKK